VYLIRHVLSTSRNRHLQRRYVLLIQQSSAV